MGIVFSNKETFPELNGCKIEAFSSHHLDAMRGLANVKFILLEEADFLPPGQQKDARIFQKGTLQSQIYTCSSDMTRTI